MIIVSIRWLGFCRVLHHSMDLRVFSGSKHEPIGELVWVNGKEEFSSEMVAHYYLIYM